MQLITTVTWKMILKNAKDEQMHIGENVYRGGRVREGERGVAYVFKFIEVLFTGFIWVPPQISYELGRCYRWKHLRILIKTQQTKNHEKKTCTRMHTSAFKNHDTIIPPIRFPQKHQRNYTAINAPPHPAPPHSTPLFSWSSCPITICDRQLTSDYNMTNWQWLQYDYTSASSTITNCSGHFLCHLHCLEVQQVFPLSAILHNSLCLIILH